jgi:hypothetical protein
MISHSVQHSIYVMFFLPNKTHIDNTIMLHKLDLVSDFQNVNMSEATC